jgi:hypothetical protein
MGGFLVVLVVVDSNMTVYMHEDEDEVTSLLPAKAFETSTTSHHQMNNNELNEFKPLFNQKGGSK